MSVKKDINFDKLLTLSREMDREVKEFLIVNHTSEEKATRTEELNIKYEYIKTSICIELQTDKMYSYKLSYVHARLSAQRILFKRINISNDAI